MHRYLLAALAGLSLFSAGQLQLGSLLPHHDERAELPIAGVNVYLGMSEPELAKKLETVEYQKLNGRTWVFADDANGNSRIEFKNGFVTYAESPVHSPGNDSFESFYLAVQFLHATGKPSCTVHALNGTDTDSFNNTVLIDCGSRSVLWMRLNAYGEQHDAVVERIGTQDLSLFSSHGREE